MTYNQQYIHQEELIMEFVNGVQAIIIDRSMDDASMNNSNILLLQSEARWTSMDIRRLKEQLTPNQQLIILPDSTNVVVIRRGEEVAQEKPTNDLGAELRALTVEDIIDWHKKEATKHCDNTCRYWAMPFGANNHICGSCIRGWINKGKGTDNYEFRSDLSNVSEKKHE